MLIGWPRTSPSTIASRSAIGPAASRWRSAAFSSAGLAPAGDFRGSAGYRLEMARVLARRALTAARARARAVREASKAEHEGNDENLAKG